MAECARGVYRSRRPRESAFYRLIEELFRHCVLGKLRRKGLLTPERIKLMESWRHSGFNVNAAARIGAADGSGRENLARYLIRAPFSVNKIRYDPKTQAVIYKTKMVPGANRSFEVFDPLDFLAAVTAHIPNRGEHLAGITDGIRACSGVGAGARGGSRRRSNRCRPQMRRRTLRRHGPIGRASSRRSSRPTLSSARTAGGPMLIVAFIEDQRLVRAILERLLLWDEARAPLVAPPVPDSSRRLLRHADNLGVRHFSLPACSALERSGDVHLSQRCSGGKRPSGKADCT